MGNEDINHPCYGCDKYDIIKKRVVNREKMLFNLYVYTFFGFLVAMGFIAVSLLLWDTLSSIIFNICIVIVFLISMLVWAFLNASRFGYKLVRPFKLTNKKWWDWVE